MGPSASTPRQPFAARNRRADGRRAATILERAQVWRPIDTARLNLLTGPRGPDGFPFDAPVTCDYALSRQAAERRHAEVRVRDTTRADVVKVKYGENNGEVFAEVASSRLFWALGFAADRMYPVKVTVP